MTPEVLQAIRERWLRTCAACDADMTTPCTCPPEDHRIVISELLDHIDELDREVVRLDHKNYLDLEDSEEEIGRLESRVDALTGERARARDLAAALEAETAAAAPIVEAARGFLTARRVDRLAAASMLDEAVVRNMPAYQAARGERP